MNCAAIPARCWKANCLGMRGAPSRERSLKRSAALSWRIRGTLFLDEIGEIPLELQPKLLRVLQEQEFERLGATEPSSGCPACRRDKSGSQAMVNQRTFREDLYYRLDIFPIYVPPLRERPSDIPLLANFFVNKYSKRMGKPIEIPPETMRALRHWHWPGNIRELENVIERSLILSEGTILNVPLGQLKWRTGTPPSHENVQTLADLERDIILRALREANGVIAAAAAKLGMKRTTLNSKMRS